VSCECVKPTPWIYLPCGDVACKRCAEPLKPQEVSKPAPSDFPMPTWWAGLTPQEAWLEYVHVQARAAAVLADK
jgi:hypothetical protein